MKKSEQPTEPTTIAELRAVQDAMEAELLSKALRAAEWRLSVAAAALGVQVSSLQRLMQRHPALAREREKRHTHRWGGRPAAE